MSPIYDWDYGPLLTALAILYLLGVSIVIIRDNRSPQSTFAWLFLTLSLPIVGLVVYIFFGRNRRIFAGKVEGSQLIGSDLNQALLPLAARHDAICARIRAREAAVVQPQAAPARRQQLRLHPHRV